MEMVYRDRNCSESIGHHMDELSILSISGIQIGLDLATSIALILSAIGVMWRLGTTSQKLQQQQIEAAEERAHHARINSREKVRIKFLLEACQGIAEHIDTFTQAVIAVANATTPEDRARADKQALEATREIYDWLIFSENKLLAIGSTAQVFAIQVAQRHFILSIKTGNGSTQLNPKEQIQSMINLYKTLLVDCRVFLLGEIETTASEFIQGQLADRFAVKL